VYAEKAAQEGNVTFFPRALKTASIVTLVERPQRDYNPPGEEKLRRLKDTVVNHSLCRCECEALECGSLLPHSCA